MSVNQPTVPVLRSSQLIEGIETIEQQALFVWQLPYAQPWFYQFEAKLGIIMLNIGRDQIEPSEPLQ